MSADIAERILAVARIQYSLIIIIMGASSWVFYKLFLVNLSKERHKIFNRLFRELATAFLLGLVVYGTHLLMRSYMSFIPMAEKIAPYTGLLSILFAAHLFIKITEIVANEYFFFKSMRAGVPLLLVNISKLILTVILFNWILTGIFDVQITSVVATSAVLTIVLGLALQDTLGNLFAAISLQIDKPFEMDDWIEIRNGQEKIVGQVKELSWRATVLQAMTDEIITLPNKTIAMSQIVNFSAKERPFLRSQVFRLPFEADLEKTRSLLLKLILETPGVLASPPPLTLVTETHESWIVLKVIYSLSDYGNQYVIADRFYQRALHELATNGVNLAANRLDIRNLG
jgi:small-conductance mechanosensitive channel